MASPPAARDVGGHFSSRLAVAHAQLRHEKPQNPELPSEWVPYKNHEQDPKPFCDDYKYKEGSDSLVSVLPVGNEEQTADSCPPGVSARDRPTTLQDQGPSASSWRPRAPRLSGAQNAAGPLTHCLLLYLSSKPNLFSLIVHGSRGYHGFKVMGVVEDRLMKF